MIRLSLRCSFRNPAHARHLFLLLSFTVKEVFITLSSSCLFSTSGSSFPPPPTLPSHRYDRRVGSPAVRLPANELRRKKDSNLVLRPWLLAPRGTTRTAGLSALIPDTRQMPGAGWVQKKRGAKYTLTFNGKQNGLPFHRSSPRAAASDTR